MGNRLRPRRLDVKAVEALLRPTKESLEMLDGITSGRKVPRNAGAIVKGIGLRLEYSQPKPAVRVAGADGEPLRIRIDLGAAVERIDPEYPVPVKVLPPGPEPSVVDRLRCNTQRNYELAMIKKQREEEAAAERGEPKEERVAVAKAPLIRRKGAE